MTKSKLDPLQVIASGDKLSLEQLRAQAATATGNADVNVTDWNASFEGGELATAALVTGVQPTYSIPLMAIGLVSQDQQTNFCASILVLNSENTTCANSLEAYAGTALYNPQVQGSQAIGQVMGIVVTGPNDAFWFSFEKPFNF